MGVHSWPNALLRGTTRQPSTCGCSLRVRSGLLPLEDYASNLVGAVRSKVGLLPPRAAQAVPGGEALWTKMGDVYADHAPEGL